MTRTAGLLLVVVGLLVALGLGACAATGTAPSEEAVARTLRVHATTGHLADAVVNIAPGAEVTTLVGPGGDPHTYQPSTRDIQRILDADVVISNGLGLEPQLQPLLERVGERHLAAGEAVPAELLLHLTSTDGRNGQPLADPHVWNSPEAWQAVVAAVAGHLAKVDPGNAEEYLANSEAYREQIDASAARARARMAEIPPGRRILVSGHDAFAYFGRTFDLEVHATDFISTEARLSAGQLSALADLVAERRVPVVFQDNQANPQAIASLREAVRARGWDVAVSDAELYADSLGAERGLRTHLEVFEHNVATVADALSGERA